jgi:hypothetical protein
MILSISLASLREAVFCDVAIQKNAWKSVKVSNKRKKLDCHALMPGLPPITIVGNAI